MTSAGGVDGGRWGDCAEGWGGRGRGRGREKLVECGSPETSAFVELEAARVVSSIGR